MCRDYGDLTNLKQDELKGYEWWLSNSHRFSHCSCSLNERSWSLWGRKSSHSETVLTCQVTGNTTIDICADSNWIDLIPSEPAVMFVLLINPSTSSSLESELATVRQEKETLTQQLLNTIKHKVALSQELEAWQVSLFRDVKLVSFGNPFI